MKIGLFIFHKILGTGIRVKLFFPSVLLVTFSIMVFSCDINFVVAKHAKIVIRIIAWTLKIKSFLSGPF